jgi:FKBP-type peptidyl-prolyl cis-trans isomerase (trigger factor)
MNELTQKKVLYENLTIEELPGSEIELSGEIPAEVVDTYRAKALKKLTKNLELPGFRKGHVPDDVAIKHIGEIEVLKEVAEQAIAETYADIVEEKKLEVVGRPQVTITKLAPGNPIGFKIKSAVFPKIELPDYKKIAESELKNHEDPEKTVVDEAEIQKELEHIQKAMTLSNKDATDATTPVPPAIDDEFAKKLGDFTDLADLKEKMKGQILVDKKNKAYDKRRLAVADEIIKKAKVEVPTIFIEGELEQMVASFNERVTRAGIELDSYLKEIGKTIEDLKKEWRTDAEKRAKLQLILNEIAQKEAVIPNIAKLDREVKHIKEHYPEADETAVRTYVKAQMTNELVFELLEGGARPEAHVHTESCDHDHK